MRITRVTCFQSISLSVLSRKSEHLDNQCSYMLGWSKVSFLLCITCFIRIEIVRVWRHLSFEAFNHSLRTVSSEVSSILLSRCLLSGLKCRTITLKTLPKTILCVDVFLAMWWSLQCSSWYSTAFSRSII